MFSLKGCFPGSRLWAGDECAGISLGSALRLNTLEGKKEK